MIQQQVILLINEREAPSLTLLDALSGIGLTSLIETLRGAEQNAHGAMRYEYNAFTRAQAAQPVAVIYEATNQCSTPELNAIAEYALKVWRGVPLIACRRPLPEHGIVETRNVRHNDAELQRIGFHLIVDTPTQLAEILREGHSDAANPVLATDTVKAATPEDFGDTGEYSYQHVAALQLPATLSAQQLHAAYTFLASLHLTGNRYQAAQRAVEHLSALLTAQRWTIYQSAQPSANAGGSNWQQLHQLASWTNAEPQAEQSFDGDMLENEFQNSSTAARTALCLGTTVRREEDDAHYLALPLLGGERVFGVLEGVRRPATARAGAPLAPAGSGKFSAEEARLIETLAAPLASALTNAWRLAEANRLTQTDDLTALYNARYLREHLAREVSRARRYGSCVAAVFIDLDDFKNVNDLHGHLVGSHVLIELANLLRESVRDTDVIARYGGDEFVIVMPETNLDQASRAAERLCESVTNYFFDGGRALEMRLTASIGVATYPLHAPTPQLLIAQADIAMYAAKADGKGCVRYAPEPTQLEFPAPSVVCESQ